MKRKAPDYFKGRYSQEEEEEKISKKLGWSNYDALKYSITQKERKLEDLENVLLSLDISSKTLQDIQTFFFEVHTIKDDGYEFLCSSLYGQLIKGCEHDLRENKYWNFLLTLNREDFIDQLVEYGETEVKSKVRTVLLETKIDKDIQKKALEHVQDLLALKRHESYFQVALKFIKENVDFKSVFNNTMKVVGPIVLQHYLENVTKNSIKTGELIHNYLELNSDTDKIVLLEGERKDKSKS